MKIMTACACIVACGLFVCSSPKETKDLLVASIDSVMSSAVDTARFNGNVLVARNGEIVYQKSFGASNFYTNEMLNDSSVFELASVSKAFTSNVENPARNTVGNELKKRLGWFRKY